MRPALLVCLLVLTLLMVESKLQQKSSLSDDDEDDAGDDWDDDDDEDDSYPSRSEVDDDGRVYKNPRNSPSADCPRNEKDAVIIGQKCLRKCSADEDCKSKKKKCRCDGACGMSCIKPDRECPELEVFQFGSMSVSGKLFGDKAHYDCDPNYHLVGLAERVCRADGHWSGSSPVCKKEANSFCPQPPKVKFTRHNATVDQTSFNLESVVHYFCEEGYVATGFQRAKCLLTDGVASWFGPDVHCEPQTCGSPPEIANGRHAGECYTFNCRVSYHCVDTYELVGKSEKRCLSDGTWFPKEAPQCVQVASVECPPPEDPLNGKSFYTSLAYNSVVSYNCEYGYTRVGVQTRRCGADRKWSDQTPVCKEIDCGLPGVLYNGWIENLETGTRLGASVIFRCNEHMTMEGNSSSVCQTDGKWRYPLPQCLAPCVVPEIDHGHVLIASQDRDHINYTTIVEHGERLVVECIQDYEFAANNTPVICNNGTWTIVPSCTPARCKQMPRPPKNGMVIAPKTTHGMKAVFKCKDGWKLIGGGPANDSVSVECSFGVWIGDIPHCIELFCPHPGEVENGKVLLVGNMGVYDYRSYVKKIVNNKQIMYDCNKGYYLSEGPPGATCFSGSWSPKELPKCTLGQHPRIRFNRRRRWIGGDDDDIVRRKMSLFRTFVDFFRRLNDGLQEPLKALLDHRREHEYQDRHTRSIQNDNETVAMAYKKFVEFFRRASKNLLVLEMDKSHDELNVWNDTKLDNQTLGLANRSRSWNDKMVNFLKVIYRKLERIDSRFAGNDTNATVHEILNNMSKNFFHVDLTGPRRGGRGRSGPELKTQREFTKLKREFERITRFYNKSMRWSEKHMKKGPKKHKNKGRKKKRINNGSESAGFYEFINEYVNEKLASNVSELETNDKFTLKNGTSVSIAEMYGFFKHIIEGRLNSTTQTSVVSTVLTKSSSDMNNEIPTAETNLPKHRIRRIRDVEGNQKSLASRDSTRKRREDLTLYELEAQQQSHVKRLLPLSELNNQIFLKNLYLNAYENEYNANVKRSLPRNNQ